jgi:tetratricopeptide (TPR) repeat protein
MNAMSFMNSIRLKFWCQLLAILFLSNNVVLAADQFEGLSSKPGSLILPNEKPPSKLRQICQQASSLGSAGRFDEAEKTIEQALTVMEQEESKKDPLCSTYLSWLAGVYLNENKNAEAEKLLRRSVALSQSKGDTIERSSLIQLAGILNDQGKTKEAEAFLKKICEGSSDKRDWRRYYSLMAGFYSKAGQFAEAEKEMKLGFPLELKALSEYEDSAARPYFEMAIFYENEGKLTIAEEYYRQAISVQEKRRGNKIVPTNEAYVAMGMLKYRQKQFAEAEVLFERALKIQRVAYTETAQPNAELYLMIAICHAARKLPSDHLFRKAQELFATTCGDDSPDLARCQMYRSSNLREEGRVAEAKALETRARKLFQQESAYWASISPKDTLDLRSSFTLPTKIAADHSGPMAPAVAPNTPPTSSDTTFNTAVIRIVDGRMVWFEQWQGSDLVQRRLMQPVEDSLAVVPRLVQLVSKDDHLELYSATYPSYGSILINGFMLRLEKGRLITYSTRFKAFYDEDINKAINAAVEGRTADLAKIDLAGCRPLSDPKFILQAISRVEKEAVKLSADHHAEEAALRLAAVFDFTERLSVLFPLRGDGQSFSRVQRWMKAWSKLDSKDYITPLVHYGSCLSQAGKAQQSIEILNTAKKLNPKNAAVRLVLGDTLWALNNRAEAKKQYQDYCLIMSTTGKSSAIPSHVKERSR